MGGVGSYGKKIIIKKKKGAEEGGRGGGKDGQTERWRRGQTMIKKTSKLKKTVEENR